MLRIYFTLFTLLFFLSASGQISLSGFLFEKKSGEALPGATISILDTETGTTSNSHGYFILQLPKADSVKVLFSYLGLKPQLRKIKLSEDLKLRIELAPTSLMVDEVVVTDNRKSDRNVQDISVGVINIPIRYVKELPALLGESDALKIIQLLPGVSAGSEGSSNLYVRGGNADQNLYLIDGVPIYQPGHLLGITSTFNPSVVKDFTLIKSGFPASQGGRLSSTIEMNFKDGNKTGFAGSGSLGLLNSSLTLEGPILNKKGSYLVSGRRTYADALAKPFIPKSKPQASLYFYDFLIGAHAHVGDKDQINLRYFQGRDLGGLSDPKGPEYDLRFGNRAISAHWTRLWNKKVASNTVAYQTEYFHNFDALQGKTFSHYYSNIKDLGLKSDFHAYLSNSYTLEFGAQYVAHEFGNRGIVAPQSADIQVKSVNQIPVTNHTEMAGYIDNTIILSPEITVSLGLRMPYYDTGSKTYMEFEPRFKAKLGTSPTSSLKLSYTRMNQFLHLITGSTSALPTDIWIPSSDVIRPQQSDQYSVGFFKNFNDNTIETSVEVYYKNMDNQVLFREGAVLTEVSNFDNETTFGRAKSYGVELFVKKNFGQLNGWVSYTWSKTTQQFDDLNAGAEFPFKYDRTHNLAVAGTYKLNDKWSFSSSFVYYTGAAFSIPNGRFFIENGGSLHSRQYPVYTHRNNERLPAHHRLDVGATRNQIHRMFGKEYDSKWVFSIYNVYSRLNAFFVYTDVNIKTNKPIAKQVSLLPIVPSISYQFEF